MVRQPSDQFTGNARVHYQHLADRVRGERAELKKWRAWAAWAVTRHVRPDLAGDPKHAVTEPTHAEIEAGLRAYGLVSEITEWRQALAD
jgi:tRNA G37 N-methylase TrmD